ncbi:hypothetical protein [Streptomyces sp. NPDC054794]
MRIAFLAAQGAEQVELTEPVVGEADVVRGRHLGRRAGDGVRGRCASA